MAPAFLIYLGYLLLLTNARSAMAEGTGIPGALWLVHGAFLSVALAMIYLPPFIRRLKYQRYLNAQA